MHRHLSILFSICLVSLFPLSMYAGQGEKETPLNLSLNLAIEQALQNNLNLKLSQEDVVIATGAIQSEQGRFDTLLSAKAGATNKELTPLILGAASEENTVILNTSLQKKFTSGTEVSLALENNRYESDISNSLIDPAYTSTISLGVSQPLLKGWGTEIQTAAIETAQTQLQASVFLVDSQAADLAALIKNAYWDLVFSWQDIEVQKLSLTLAQTLLAEIKIKIDAGKLAQIEIYQPQSEVARREESLIAAERAIGVAEDELKYLLNSKNWLTSLNPTDLPEKTPVHLNQETIFNNAMANRPDIKAADLNIKAAQIQTTVAEDNTRPALAMAGSIGYGGTDDSFGDAFSNTLDKPKTQWQVGLNFSVPLQNSYAQGAQAQAVAALRKAKTNAELLRLQVKKAIRTTVRDVNLALKAMEATRKTSIATLKRLEAEQAKFEAGSATTLDVLIAQNAYSQALSQENKTIIIYAKSLAEIDRIQGIVSINNSGKEELLSTR